MAPVPPLLFTVGLNRSRIVFSHQQIFNPTPLLLGLKRSYQPLKPQPTATSLVPSAGAIHLPHVRYSLPAKPPHLRLLDPRLHLFQKLPRQLLPAAALPRRLPSAPVSATPTHPAPPAERARLRHADSSGASRGAPPEGLDRRLRREKAPTSPFVSRIMLLKAVAASSSSSPKTKSASNIPELLWPYCENQQHMMPGVHS